MLYVSRTSPLHVGWSVSRDQWKQLLDDLVYSRWKWKGTCTNQPVIFSGYHWPLVLVWLINFNNIVCFQPRCGLPISTYFSAVKIKWVMENCPDVLKAIEEEKCLFGTVDTWLIWVRKRERERERERERPPPSYNFYMYIVALYSITLCHKFCTRRHCLCAILMLRLLKKRERERERLA